MKLSDLRSTGWFGAETFMELGLGTEEAMARYEQLEAEVYELSRNTLGSHERIILSKRLSLVERAVGGAAIKIGSHNEIVQGELAVRKSINALFRVLSRFARLAKEKRRG